ncbi:AoPex11B [Colletotrichum sojae]|uniref:AoPex11B n=1 Tax=Colletotrichum sojae TaxID=2175907 RepID=A0A8H6IUI4_9PEZI|nr:AoPex11B [Colletotrichum sojae]
MAVIPTGVRYFVVMPSHVFGIWTRQSGAGTGKDPPDAGIVTSVFGIFACLLAVRRSDISSRPTTTTDQVPPMCLEMLWDLSAGFPVSVCLGRRDGHTQTRDGQLLRRWWLGAQPQSTCLHFFIVRPDFHLEADGADEQLIGKTDGVTVPFQFLELLETMPENAAPSGLWTDCLRVIIEADGIERLLRLIQAILQTISSFRYPFLITLHLVPLVFQPTCVSQNANIQGCNIDAASLHLVLLGLRERLNLARRFFRLFRFLDAFSTVYTDLGSAKQNETAFYRCVSYLDLLARTFNGMYLLTEALTLVDALQVDDLAPLGKANERVLKIEAMRFWFVALVAGICATLLRLYGTLRQDSPAEKAPSSTEAVPNHSLRNPSQSVEPSDKSRNTSEGPLSDKRGPTSRDTGKLLRKLSALSFDVFIPGSVLGLVPAKSGTVGLAMICSSILTGLDVWDRSYGHLRAPPEPTPGSTSNRAHSGAMPEP